MRDSSCQSFRGIAIARRTLLRAGGMGGARYNSCDPIWKHPTTGGTIYVGNVEGECGVRARANASLSVRG